MYSKIERVGPARAAEFLAKSPGNRATSEAKVDQYASDMAAGKWMQTHQGFCFGKGGIFVDGHHRCLAIIKSGVTITTMVTYDSDTDSPRGIPIDIGLARRAAYLLDIPTALAALASLLGRIVTTKKPSPSGLVEYVRFLKDPLEMLLSDGTNTAATVFSSAPVRLAAIMRMVDAKNTAPYVCSIYRGLVLGDVAKLPPIAVAFWRNAIKRRMGSMELLTRCLAIFDPRCASQKGTLIKNWESRHAETVDYVIRIYRGK